MDDKDRRREMKCGNRWENRERESEGEREGRGTKGNGKWNDKWKTMKLTNGGVGKNKKKA